MVENSMEQREDKFVKKRSLTMKVFSRISSDVHRFEGALKYKFNMHLL